MQVQHSVSNIERVNENRIRFDAQVAFTNGSVFSWTLTNCTLVNVHGSWVLFGPSRFDRGTFTELVGIPFPVRQALAASVLEAISEGS